MAPHPLEQLIRAADAAITAEDFDALMDFYADDATLVVKPGLYVTGKANIRVAFVRIAEHDSSRTKCEYVCPTVIIENTLGIASAARIQRMSVNTLRR